MMHTYPLTSIDCLMVTPHKPRCNTIAIRNAHSVPEDKHLNNVLTTLFQFSGDVQLAAAFFTEGPLASGIRVVVTINVYSYDNIYTHISTYQYTCTYAYIPKFI